MIEDTKKYAEWLKTLKVEYKVAIMHNRYGPTQWTIHTVTIRKPNGMMELTPAYSGQQPVKVRVDGRIMPVSQHLRIEPITDDIRTTIRKDCPLCQ